MAKLKTVNTPIYSLELTKEEAEILRALIYNSVAGDAGQVLVAIDDLMEAKGIRISSDVNVVGDVKITRN